MPSNPEDSITIGTGSNTWTTYTTSTDNTTITLDNSVTITYVCSKCGHTYTVGGYHYCMPQLVEKIMEHQKVYKTKYITDWTVKFMGKEGESVKQVYEVMVVSTVKDGDDVDLDQIIVQPKLVIAKDQEEAVQKILVGEAAILVGVDFKVLARQFRGG